jgi:hypothetical protein
MGGCWFTVEYDLNQWIKNYMSIRIDFCNQHLLLGFRTGTDVAAAKSSVANADAIIRRRILRCSAPDNLLL